MNSTYSAVKPNSRQRPRSGLFGYLAVFLVFLAIYTSTAQRGPAWQDSGIFQWRILNFDLTGWLGLALSHPLLILLGKMFSVLPFGSLAWRINLPAAVAGAFAVANVALLVRRLVPQRPLAGWVAGGFFGLAHTVWWLSTICESQALLVALFTAELHVLVSLVRKPRTGLVVLLGFVNGLALSAHNLALLALPAYGVLAIYLCVDRRIPWRSVGLMIVGWLIGASLFLAVIVHEAVDAGLVEAVRSALFGRSWQGAVLGASGKPVVMGLAYVLYNFPNLSLVFAVAGLWSLRKSIPAALWWAFLYLTIVYLLFAIRYGVPDQFMFFLPFYAMVAVLSGVGFAAVAGGAVGKWLTRAAVVSVFFAPVVYALAPDAIKALEIQLPGRKDLAYRDAATYWLTPWKHLENSAGRFAEAALTQAPRGAVIVADGTSYYPLVWVKKLRGGAGVEVLLAGDATPQQVPPGTEKLFVVSNVKGYYPRWLDRAADLEKEGVLFRVKWRKLTSVTPAQVE